MSMSVVGTSGLLVALLSAIPARGVDAAVGIESRLIPVSAAMSEDAIDPTKRVENFGSANDVAFVVELTNQSDAPVRFRDTRYGNSYGKSSGKPNSDWFSQFLFDLDVYDADGKPVGRPAVEIVDIGLPVSGALVSTLEPGQKHHFLIRPGRWLSAMKFRPDSGSYQVAVRYNGLNPSEKKRRLRTPEAERTELTTPRATFTVGNTTQTDSTPRRRWGRPQNGLRAAAVFSPNVVGHKHGTKPGLELHIQNVSKEPISISCGITLSEMQTVIRGSDDAELKVGTTFYSGWRLTTRITLQRKQIAVLQAGNLGVAATDAQANAFEDITNRTLVAPAGAYSLQLKGNFGNFQLKDGEGKVLSPLAEDWKGMLESGVTQFEILAE